RSVAARRGTPKSTTSATASTSTITTTSASKSRDKGANTSSPRSKTAEGYLNRSSNIPCHLVRDHLVRHHISDHVHGHPIRQRAEPLEVPLTVGFALPAVGDVGVVGADHHQPAF